MYPLYISNDLKRNKKLKKFFARFNRLIMCSSNNFKNNLKHKTFPNIFHGYSILTSMEDLKKNKLNQNAKQINEFNLQSKCLAYRNISWSYAVVESYLCSIVIQLH